MKVLANKALDWRYVNTSSACAFERDSIIDTMRGVAILMVIAIHSLPKAESYAFVTAIDALFRPCVPVFLFASGYLTAKTASVPLAKRVKRALGPYTIAFVAAYAFMALANPSMDHRPITIVMRYVLAYAFVYYYVFVYVGCTFALFLAFAVAGREQRVRPQRLVVLLSIAMIAGLTIGAYINPLMQHFGVPNHIIEEVRIRDVPFWFAFAATGVIVGSGVTKSLLRELRYPIAATTVLAYAVYASIRIAGIGDAAEYDSIAFFFYATLFCLTMFAFSFKWQALASLGSASYFIYLWHIFMIMLLRDVSALQQHAVASFIIEFAAALAWSVLLVEMIRRSGAPRIAQWLGA
jgi:surface polysaccharide O-acyltransferase-like enzyme